MIYPHILRQVDECLQGTNGPDTILRALAAPAAGAILKTPDAIFDPAIRLEGDDIQRQFFRNDTDRWHWLDHTAREIGISRQTLRILMPILTLLVLSAIRRATAPVFRRHLVCHQPDDNSTDPFTFAARHAETLRQGAVKPQASLRWLDIVLTRAQDDDGMHLVAEPRDRFL